MIFNSYRVWATTIGLNCVFIYFIFFNNLQYLTNDSIDRGSPKGKIAQNEVFYQMV